MYTNEILKKKTKEKTSTTGHCSVSNDFPSQSKFICLTTNKEYDSNHFHSNQNIQRPPQDKVDHSDFVLICSDANHCEKNSPQHSGNPECRVRT